MHPINKIFDKVFMITLEGSQRSKDLQGRFDFDYELFYGVDGRRIDRRGSRWSHGQLGCTMSHLKLYEHIIEKKISNVLILEDDALPHDNIKYLEQHMSQLPVNWGMIYLFYTAGGISNNYNNNWFKVSQSCYRDVMCTSSIALQLDFVKEIYDLNKIVHTQQTEHIQLLLKRKIKNATYRFP